MAKMAQTNSGAGAGTPTPAPTPAAPARLTAGQIEEALKGVPEWSEVGGVLQRTFGFKDFISSMKFVNTIAEAAEAAQHHPDILIRWNKVTLSLSTHDASGITKKDFDFARKADALVGKKV